MGRNYSLTPFVHGRDRQSRPSQEELLAAVAPGNDDDDEMGGPTPANGIVEIPEPAPLSNKNHLSRKVAKLGPLFVLMAVHERSLEQNF
jgi:hypothetical protein